MNHDSYNLTISEYQALNCLLFHWFCMYECECICVNVLYTHTHTHTHIYNTTCLFLYIQFLLDLTLFYLLKTEYFKISTEDTSRCFTYNIAKLSYMVKFQNHLTFSQLKRKLFLPVKILSQAFTFSIFYIFYN
jgi:hypothetical protein